MRRLSVVISNNANRLCTGTGKGNMASKQDAFQPKQYETREAFNEALLAAIQSYGVDLVVLAGCLVVIPEIIGKSLSE